MFGAMIRHGQDKVLVGFLAKAAWILFLRYVLPLAAGWCFAWGVAVLVLRAVVGFNSPALVWGSAGLVAMAASAAVLAYRRIPSHESARALIDCHSRCGGLLMASSEIGLGVWQERMPPLVVPRLCWRGRRTWGLFWAACAFVAISFAVPQRYVTPMSQRPLNVESEVADLQRKIEILEEEQVLEPEQATEMAKKLERVAAEARGEDPAKTWEALDHLDEAAAAAARQSAEEALAKTEKAAKAESLARGLGEAAADLDPAALSQAMEKLAELVNKAAADNEALRSALGEEMCSACQAGSLDLGQCKELAACLGQCKEGLAGKLAQLAEAGLISPQALDKIAELGQCDGAGLAEFLKEGEGEGLGLSCSEQIDLWLAEGRPGQGGVDRGRGDAPMTWTDPSSEEGVDFTEQALPPASVAALKENRLVGVSIGAPTVGAPAEPTGQGGLDGAAAGGGSAHTHTILPRHRGSVKRYFEREEP